MINSQNVQFHLNDFEGPLDLLLQLIKKSEMNIYDIDITEITKQYFDFLDTVNELEVNLVGDFFVMAANLMEIKAKMLLQKEVEIDEEEDPREDLVQKLVEYRKYKEASKKLKSNEIKRNKYHSTIPMKIKSDIENIDINVDLLTKAFNKVLIRNEEKNISKKTEKIYEWNYSIQEQTNFIEDVLADNKYHSFDYFFNSDNLEKIITNFLAILEMVKKQEIKLEISQKDRLYLILVGENY
ncbi:segregation/condensation protein A [Lactobacillus sp. S2-2]|uniref:segregation and condensation protein A n=1 Tax=Lactobacillus sp. S2-2 TaxID=2692917 RepID=UPI001F1985A1|nr:segregation/condensation protein A [Lactobacillus sp. S2-2]MCF6515012.1 segregation/condensation protein A [Lactobacillus sp. S2-2]